MYNDFLGEFGKPRESRLLRGIKFLSSNSFNLDEKERNKVESKNAVVDAFKARDSSNRNSKQNGNSIRLV